MVINRGVLVCTELWRVLGADITERLVQGFGRDRTSEHKFGGFFWTAEVIDLRALHDNLLVDFGERLPFQSQLIRRLLMGIQVMVAAHHFGAERM